MRIVERLPAASFYKSATDTSVEGSKFPDLQWRFIAGAMFPYKGTQLAPDLPILVLLDYPTNHPGRGDSYTRGPPFFREIQIQHVTSSDTLNFGG